MKNKSKVYKKKKNSRPFEWAIILAKSTVYLAIRTIYMYFVKENLPKLVDFAPVQV